MTHQRIFISHHLQLRLVCDCLHPNTHTVAGNMLLEHVASEAALSHMQLLQEVTWWTGCCVVVLMQCLARVLAQKPSVGEDFEHKMPLSLCPS